MINLMKIWNSLLNSSVSSISVSPPKAGDSLQKSVENIS